MKPLTTLLLPLFLLSAAGCRLLGELIHNTPPHIVAHRPAGDVVAPFFEIEIDFSAAMNRTVTETAFSLEIDGQEMDGRFRWRSDARGFVFVPDYAPQPGNQVHIYLHTDAEDRWGNSLVREYEFNSFVNLAGPAPQLSGHDPRDNDDEVELRRPLELHFSQPIEPVSLYGLLAIEPDIRGNFVWEQGYRLARFEPLEDYRSDTLYRITLDGILRARAGAVTLIEEEFAFITALSPVPEVVAVTINNRSGSERSTKHTIALSPIDDLVLNERGVERVVNVHIHFSSPIAAARRARLLELTPPIPFDLAWAPTGTELMATLLTPLQWNRIYEIRVLDRRYRFVVDGVHSRPPRVTQVLFIPDSGRPGNSQLLQESANVSFPDSDAAALLFHLELATDAAVDLGAFGESFRIESTSAIFNFVTRDIEVGISPDGRPFARALLEVTRNGVPPDIVTVSLSEEFRDSLGNRIANPIRISVNGL